VARRNIAALRGEGHQVPMRPPAITPHHLNHPM
jgi:hypothetical protein